MNPRIVKGSMREIADVVSRLDGEVTEAIVFVNDPLDTPPTQSANAASSDIFAEMENLTVRRGDSDSSRESLYRPGDRE